MRSIIAIAAGRHYIRSASNLSVLVILLVTLISCAMFLPRSLVITNPSTLSPISGKRPTVFLLFNPSLHSEMIMLIEAPDGGGAYLTIGKAVDATYKSAFGAFFEVILRSSRGAGYIAFIDLDDLKLTSTAEELEPKDGIKRARMTMRLTHTLRLETVYRARLETFDIDVSVEEIITYHNNKDFIQKAAGLASTLFNKTENVIFEHLKDNPTGIQYMNTM